MLIVNTRYYTNVMFDARNQNVENLTLPENVLSNFEFVIIGMRKTLLAWTKRTAGRRILTKHPSSGQRRLHKHTTRCDRQKLET
jgi:hypothetical protein